MQDAPDPFQHSWPRQKRANPCNRVRVIPRDAVIEELVAGDIAYTNHKNEMYIICPVCSQGFFLNEDYGIHIEDGLITLEAGVRCPYDDCSEAFYLVRSQIVWR